MQTQCDFYDLKISPVKVNDMVPLARHQIADNCASFVRVTSNYLVTSCPNSAGNFTVSVFALTAEGGAKTIYQTTAAVRARVEATEISSTLLVVFYQAAYFWQGVKLIFIDTIEIIAPTPRNKLGSFRTLVTQRRFFFESHASDLKALHSLQLHFTAFLGSPNPSVSAIAQSAGTLDDFDFEPIT